MVSPVHNLLLATPCLLHAGFFVAAVLLGIARYGHAVPVIATLLMTLWSIGFLLHGIAIYRTGSSVESPTLKPQDGIVKTIVSSSVISAVMWVMWTLATDARDASPWHLSIWLTLIAAAISTIIIGKRTRYNHWLKTYTPDTFDVEDSKLKRYDTSKLSLELDDDGEFPDNFDDTNSENRINWR